MSKIEEKVETLLKDVIENLGYELYDVEYAKEGKDYFLRIFIEKEGNIDLNDCEKVNNEINDILDEVNYIKEQYFLEVSSTGVEKNIRKEKHLERNVGNKIEAKLFTNVEKKKQVIGILKSFDKNTITIKEEGSDLILDRKNISQMKTVYDW